MALPRPVRSANGTAIGIRGERTRQRLLDATSECLENDGFRGLRVANIAERAGTSPATFYHYFQDPTEALLIQAERAGEEFMPIAELIDQDWSGATGRECVRSLVERFFAYWEDHRALLRVRNLAAQERDARFSEIRNVSLQPITERFAAKCADAQRRGAVSADLDPMVVGAAVVAVLERMAAFRPDIETHYTIEADVLSDTVVDLVRSMLVGDTARS